MSDTKIVLYFLGVIGFYLSLYFLEPIALWVMAQM